LSKTLNFLVVCADGAATSTVAIVAVREAFEEMGYTVNFTQGRVADVELTVEHGNFDAIISTAGTNFDLKKDIPVFNGVPFLTGIGKEALIEQIVEAVTK
jgi:PTS system, Lactose/Cellobiose specific IIB subunit.